MISAYSGVWASPPKITGFRGDARKDTAREEKRAERVFRNSWLSLVKSAQTI